MLKPMPVLMTVGLDNHLFSFESARLKPNECFGWRVTPFRNKYNKRQRLMGFLQTALKQYREKINMLFHAQHGERSISKTIYFLSHRLGISVLISTIRTEFKSEVMVHVIVKWCTENFTTHYKKALVSPNENLPNKRKLTSKWSTIASINSSQNGGFASKDPDIGWKSRTGLLKTRQYIIIL